MLKFKPIGQNLHRTDTFGVVADSVEYLKVEFDFSSSDFGGITTAVFSPFYNKGINYEVVLDDNNSCIVPEEVIKHRGFNVSIYSVIGNKKITSDKFSVPVAESGYAKGETPKDPTPTVYEQLLEIVNNTKSIAKSVRDDADSGAFNGTNGTDGVGVSKAEISADGILTITLTDGKVINVGNVKGEKGDPSVIAIDDSAFSMSNMGDAIYCTKKEVTIQTDSDNKSTVVVPQGTLIASYKPKPYFGNAYHYLIIIGECTFKDNKYKYGIHRYYNISDKIVSSTSFDDFALKTEIPTKTSHLTNDNDFVSDADYTHTDNNFTDEEKARLESDVATKDYVEQEIATFDFIKIVEELPETGLPNRTYFVPKANQQTNDLYDEYMWVKNTWEFVGTRQIEVDLTNYIKNTDYVTANQGGILKKLSLSFGIAPGEQYTANSSYTGIPMIARATPNEVKVGDHSYKPIVPNNQQYAVFYGLAKASGDTSQAKSTNALGKYTDEARNKIQEMLGVQALLSAGENIVINNNVISSTCVIKPLALSVDKTTPTMLADIGAGAFITTNTGYIKTSGGFQKAIGKGAELIIVSTLKDNIAQLCVTVQTGSSVLFFWDKMTADMTNEIFISTLSVKNDLNSLNDRNVMSGTLAKTMFDERIKKSEVGDGLKYENGKLSLDIPTATAETLYGGEG